jgi:hypothetical protein
MDITTFDDLLTAARAQPQPQRLLFVFAGIELPDDATAAQRENFERGEGGALVPQMCVDKAPEELASFADLVEEARTFGPEWGMVFAAALSGAAGRAPSSEDAIEPLERMVESIKQGRLAGFIPFDTQGHTVQLG